MTVFSQLPTDPKLATKIVQEQMDDVRRAREMGKVGVWLGSAENATRYVVSFMGILLVLGIVGVVLLPGSAWNEKKDAVQLLTSLLLAILGYLFGSKGSTPRT